MPSDILPLPLTSIERLHLLDDHPAWPNWIGCVLHLAGELREPVAQTAFGFILWRHLLADRGADTSRRRWQWVRLPPTQPHFQFCRTGTLDEWERPPPPDLRRTSGALCHASTDGTRSRVCLMVHHALADGLGGLQMVRDWLKVYDNLERDREPAAGLGPLDPSLLRNRNRLGLLRWSWLRHLCKQPVGLYGATKFLTRRFATLGRSGGADAAGRPVEAHRWPVLLSASLDRGQLAAIRSAARAWGVSLNDWLVGALFETLVEKSQAAGQDPQQWQRVIVPISIRERGDARMPAANRTTLVQLDRRQADLRPRVRLMQGIRFELGVIRNWQLDRFFLLAVRMFALLPGGLGRQTRPDKPRATAMLTNLGKPLMRTGLDQEAGCLRVGSLRLESMDLVAPVRYGLPVAFAVHQYRHRLWITAQMDPAAIDRNEARSLLDGWISRISNATGNAPV